MVVFKADSKNNNHIAHKEFHPHQIIQQSLSFLSLFSCSCNVFGASPFLVLASRKWQFWESFLLTFYFHLLIIFKERQVEFNLLAPSCD